MDRKESDGMRRKSASRGPAQATLSIAVLLLVAMCAFLFLENRSLGSKVMIKDDELSKANDTIGRLMGDLSERDQKIARQQKELTDISIELNASKNRIAQAELEIESLGIELNATRSSLENKSISLEETRAEFRNLTDDITDVRQSLDESIGWFRDNSYLPPSLSYFVPYVRERCVTERRLNLACVSLMMERRLGFRYISESNDRLYSISEMVSRNGGDCEDYSLFLKALLNSMKGSSGSLVLSSWEPGGGEYLVYNSTDDEWFYQGQEVELGRLDGSNPVAICYVTSAADERIEGHCIVALSSEGIGSSDDLTGLGGALTFDPQDGMYMGEIGEDLRLCENGDIGCGSEKGQIIIVISDDDLYQFRDGKWISFSILRDQAASLIDKAGSMASD